MRRLLATALAFVLGSITATAGGENIGLLVEWIQVDGEAAGKLLPRPTDEEDATALRAELEKLLDAGRAELVDSSYLITASGQRAMVESTREHIYASEADFGGIPGTFAQDWKRPRTYAKYDVSPAALGLSTLQSFFDIRNLGTSVEIEPTLAADGRIEINIALERTRHTGDRVLGDRRLALNGTVQPDFRVQKTSTTFVANERPGPPPRRARPAQQERPAGLPHRPGARTPGETDTVRRRDQLFQTPRWHHPHRRFPLLRLFPQYFPPLRISR